MTPPVTDALHQRVDTLLQGAIVVVVFFVVVAFAVGFETVRRAARRSA
jgi:hypothetical protein